MMFRKNNLFLAPLPEISTNSNENMDMIISGAFAKIYGNFGESLEILNLRKVHNPNCNKP